MHGSSKISGLKGLAQAEILKKIGDFILGS